MALTTVPASLSATALTLTTAAQPNITSVGTLTGLTVSGNIAGTLTTAAQTNITSLGTLSGLTVTNPIAGSVTGTAATVTGAAQTNITSLGTLSSLTVTGTSTLGVVDASSFTDVITNTIYTQSSSLDIDVVLTGRDVTFTQGSTALMTIKGDASGTTVAGTITNNGNILIDVASGNPYVSIKTAGTGNNPFTEYRAGNNTVFDTAAIFSGTTDRFRIGYGASGSISTDLFSITQGGDTTIAGGLAVDTTTFNVDNTNNRVGIGTATPQRLLTLFENDQPVFQITNNTSGGQSTRGLIQYIASGTTTAIFDNQGSGSGGQFTFMQAGATRMVIDTNGNVGIGAAPDTTNYGGTFKYFGVDAGAGYAVIEGQTSSTTAGDGAASFFASTTGSSGLKLLGGMQVYNYASSSSNAEGGLKFFTATGGNIPVRMTIDNSGNVGIGTASISSWTKLQVAGTAGAQTGATQALYITSPTTTANEGVGLRMSAASGSHEAVGIIGVVNNPSGNAGAMTFHTYNLGATIPEQMRITNTGNVGIGTTSPQASLHVNKSSNVKIARFSTTGAQGITVGTSTTDSTGRAVHLAHDGTGSGYIHPYNYAGSSFDAMEIRASTTALKKADGTTALNVDAAGIVTQEYLPAFHAYYNANAYSPSNSSVFAHNATRFDNGGNYDTTNHRFTAPVAGVYQFYFRTIIYGSGSNGHISFRINGAGAAGANGHYSFTVSAWNVFEIHMLKDLAANDYVDVYNNTRTATYYHGGAWNEFSGYLIG